MATYLTEVEPYFSACDLVILPYESATQSGIVQIAFGFEKPVVVTNVGGLPDVVRMEKPDTWWRLGTIQNWQRR
ncbi:MAG: glycosyltransferase [Enterocloster clostridioformis]